MIVSAPFGNYPAILRAVQEGPTAGGSGVVKHIRVRYPDAIIIGGGGITDLDDAQKFQERGANHIALGSMLFNPF